MFRSFNLIRYSNKILREKLFVLLLIGLLLAGCQADECTGPEDIYYKTVRKSVPASRTDSNLWVDTGVVLQDGSEVSINIDGSANLCGLTRNERAPNSPVRDSELADRNIALHFAGVNTNPAFFIHEKIAQYAFLTKPDFLVQEGDHIYLSLIPITITVDCDNPNGALRIADKTECFNGALIDHNGTKVKVPGYHGTVISNDIGSYLRAEDNVVFRNVFAHHNRWIRADTPDISYARNGMIFKEFVIPSSGDADYMALGSRFVCGTRNEIFTSNMFERTSAPLLNKRCKHLAYRLGDIDSSTLAFTALAEVEDTQDMSKLLKARRYIPMVQMEICQSSTTMVGSCQQLKPAFSGDKVDDPLSYNASSIGMITLDAPYLANSSGKFLLLRTPKFPVSGGFNFRVLRECKDRTRKNLYMYVGDTPPKGAPGVSGAMFPDNANNLLELTTDKYPAGGRIYFGIKYDSYDNSRIALGAFDVLLRYPRIANGVLGPMVVKVRENIYSLVYGPKNANGVRSKGSVPKIYEGIVNRDMFKSILAGIITLFIIIKAFIYIMGATQNARHDMLISIVKICFVFAFTLPSSWQEYYNLVYQFLVEGTDFIIVALTKFDGGVINVNNFNFLDDSLARFGIRETWIQVLALFLAGPVGWIVIIIVAVSVVSYAKVILFAIIMYLLSILMISFLIAVLPVFILSILFKYTSKIFNAWFNIVLANIFRPILLLTGMAILNQLVAAALYVIFNFSVCDGCVISLKFSKHMDQFCLIDGPVPIGYNALLNYKSRMTKDLVEEGATFFTLPIPISGIIMLFILSKVGSSLAKALLSVGSNIAKTFNGSVDINAADNLGQGILGLVGMDRESRNRRIKNNKEAVLGKDGKVTDKEKRSLIPVRNDDKKNVSVSPLNDANKRKMKITPLDQKGQKPLDRKGKNETSSEDSDDRSSNNDRDSRSGGSDKYDVQDDGVDNVSRGRGSDTSSSDDSSNVSSSKRDSRSFDGSDSSIHGPESADGGGKSSKSTDTGTVDRGNTTDNKSSSDSNNTDSKTNNTSDDSGD